VKVTESLRTLGGRNRARLVKADDGRYFVQKLFEDANGSDRLFNETFASQLGLVPGLPFAAWSELVGGCSGAHRSSFGSELVLGDIFEYLPTSWYQNVQNRPIFLGVYFLIFGATIQIRGEPFFRGSHLACSTRVLRGSRSDVSTDDQGPLLKRIAKTRCLDSRIYSDPPATVVRDLQDIAYNIHPLAKYGLELVERSVPTSWGTLAHRKKVITGLKRRDGQLTCYIEAILQFLTGMEQSNAA
jgi:hypothetical protein